jgi:hypothetical protein
MTKKLNVFEICKLIKGAELLIKCSEKNIVPSEEDKLELIEYLKLIDKIEEISKKKGVKK